MIPKRLKAYLKPSKRPCIVFGDLEINILKSTVFWPTSASAFKRILALFWPKSKESCSSLARVIPHS